LDSQNYWTRRLTRRRALAGVSAGGVGLAALGLVGCGGSSGSSTPQNIEQKQQEVASILSQRIDTTAQAATADKTAIMQAYTTIDLDSLDPLGSPVYVSALQGNWYYPKLLQYTAGYRVPATGGVEANLAEKWEQPDPLHLVLHLRQGATWDPRPPTNKRVIDADDVVFSWNKFAQVSISRADLAWSATNTSAAVTKVEATDKNTVTFTMGFPYAPLIPALAYSRYVQIMPRESAGGANGFDPVKDVRGGGPYLLDKYQKNVAWQFRKNPDYWNANNFLNGGFDYPIIMEQAAQLAQFRAKKIWSYTPPQENLIGLKSDFPELVLDKAAFSRGQNMIYFGLAPDSPFADPRVRQAASMVLDRDAYLETFSNVSTFKNAGYPIETRWHSHVSSGWDGYWVDPQGKDMGDGAKYFQMNVAEAKKLLDAAGYPNGIDTQVAYISTTEYGSLFPKQCEVLAGMMRDSNLFKLKLVNPDYKTDYVPNYYYAKGNFKGVAMGATTAFPEIDQYIFAYFHSTGGREKSTFMGKNPDTKSDQMIEAQRKEADPTKRTQIIQDWQKYAATWMPQVLFPGQANSFSLTWPWYGNAGVWRAWDAESDVSVTAPHVWYDKSKYTG
jgi:ABC-type transport system substrate-binding protein